MGGDSATALDFLREYERRTNIHDVEELAPLIAEDATYWFSDGSHTGRDAILSAIGETFETIRDETYSITDITLVAAETDLAVFRYTFRWSGLVDGALRSGHGRGTNVVVRRDGRWLMLHEHLSA